MIHKEFLKGQNLFLLHLRWAGFLIIPVHVRVCPQHGDTEHYVPLIHTWLSPPAHSSPLSSTGQWWQPRLWPVLLNSGFQKPFLGIKLIYRIISPMVTTRLPVVKSYCDINHPLQQLRQAKTLHRIMEWVGLEGNFKDLRVPWAGI